MNNKKPKPSSDLFAHIAGTGDAMTDFYTLSTDKRQELLDAIITVSDLADSADKGPA
ncbi:MAG TPA: hypothetical protein VN446_08870 [Candidatus Acidoferrum sp.]|nr:hypothetical protein [Candidatus Acidoferrum sp.]